MILLTGNIRISLGCTKTRSPRIGTVLHWRALNVHIFDTDPSLVNVHKCPFCLVNFSQKGM